MTETSAPVENRDTVDGGMSTDNSPADTAAADTAGNVFSDTETQNAAHPVEWVLLLGMDRAKGELGRTDGIVIAVFDYATNRVGVISVPRDLYVDIPGLEQQGRINTVYRVGSRALGREKGLALLKSVIHVNLGITIDYSIAVDFDGFVAAVDELGGITVDVKCPIEDCFWMGGETCTPLSLAAGEHHLDGKTALLFARSRHGRTDLDRGRRQQAVLMGLKKRLVRPAVLLRLRQLVSKLGPFVETDLPLDAMLRMGSLVHSAGKQNIHGLVMRSPIVEGRTTEDKKSVLELNRSQWQRALAKLFDEAPPGVRHKGICPAANVGLNWRERKQKVEQKRLSVSANESDN